jgi:hypothetical protein
MTTEITDQATILTPEETTESRSHRYSSLPVRIDYQSDPGTADESLHRMGPGNP